METKNKTAGKTATETYSGVTEMYDPAKEMEKAFNKFFSLAKKELGFDLRLSVDPEYAQKVGEEQLLEDARNDYYEMKQSVTEWEDSFGREE
jgi:hypothetical protein